MATDIESLIKSLTEPSKLYSCSEVLSDPCPVPPKSGLYAFYFKEIPGNAPTDGCVVKDDLTLLYVGRSVDLRTRIRGDHFNGEADLSTLRKTLGVLLEKPLRRVGDKGSWMSFTPAGENWLNDWMAKNAFVCWVEHPDIEKEILQRKVIPLNIQHNKHHPFNSRLLEMRKEAIQRANEMPISKTADINPLIKPSKLFSHSEVLSEPSLVPAEGGLCAFYFKEIPGNTPTNGCIVKDGLTLLYVGESNNLRMRVRREHFNGEADVSTFRKSIGLLLNKYPLRRMGEEGSWMSFTPKGEEWLKDWMAKNVFVCWMTESELKKDKSELKKEVMKSISLPLNIQHNKHHPFYSELKEMNKKAKERAKQLPISKTTTINPLIKPSKLYSRSRILSDPCPVPAEGGLCAFYFKEIPSNVPTDGCIVKDGLTLLYVGESNNLRTRVVNDHFNGNIGYSTLRKSLAALLKKKNGVIQFTRQDEDSLNNWMDKNVFVYWKTQSQLKKHRSEVKKEILENQPLPLNIQENKGNSFSKKLSAMRRSIK